MPHVESDEEAQEFEVMLPKLGRKPTNSDKPKVAKVKKPSKASVRLDLDFKEVQTYQTKKRIPKFMKLIGKGAYSKKFGTYFGVVKDVSPDGLYVEIDQTGTPWQGASGWVEKRGLVIR